MSTFKQARQNAEPKPLANMDEIRRLTEAKAEAEAAQFQANPEPEPGNDSNGHDQEEHAPITSAFVLNCLRDNEDGDARLYIELHRDRFIFDHAAGVWFVWKGHYWQEDILGEALQAIEALVEVYGREFQRQAWLALKSAKSNKENK